MKTLNQLFLNTPEILIEHLMIDSRKQMKNALFYCLKGIVNDGHKFVNQAIKNGAKAIVYTDPIDVVDESIVLIHVDDVLNALNESAKLFYDDPASQLTLFGVTGTNGKSTIAKTIKEVYNNYQKTGYSGTISIEYGNKVKKPNYTTPETIELLDMLNHMVKAKMKAAALEVSSQGLDQKRVDSIQFDVAIFTNLTHDHLDYHDNMENYYIAKRRLFFLLKENARSIINIDDVYGERLFNELNSKKYSYSIEKEADYQAIDISYFSTHTDFTLKVDKNKYVVKTNFVSQFNLSNLLAIIAACHQAGMPIEDILAACDHLPAVDGRMNVIEMNQGYNCIVDYAHTPDGFEKIYKFAHTITPENKKIITVFGAAGKRDTKKRAILGSISDRNADLIILTEEDPRNESALNICHEIAAGIKDTPYVIVLDRYDAIYQALDIANSGDTVLVLAKGNEQYLDRLYGKEYWMSDIEAVKEILSLKGESNELK